jgi:hypothetical protein
MNAIVSYDFPMEKIMAGGIRALLKKGTVWVTKKEIPVRVGIYHQASKKDADGNVTDNVIATIPARTMIKVTGKMVIPGDVVGMAGLGSKAVPIELEDGSKHHVLYDDVWNKLEQVIS